MDACNEGDHFDPVAAFGEFVRSQRTMARLSLRELAERTNLSNPYLSKLERGLHKPSVEAVATIARALEMPVEALLARAAGLSEGSALSTEQAIRQDPSLGEDQKLALLSVYRSFVESRP